MSHYKQHHLCLSTSSLVFLPHFITCNGNSPENYANLCVTRPLESENVVFRLLRVVVLLLSFRVVGIEPNRSVFRGQTTKEKHDFYDFTNEK